MKMFRVIWEDGYGRHNDILTVDELKTLLNPEDDFVLNPVLSISVYAYVEREMSIVFRGEGGYDIMDDDTGEIMAEIG